MSMFSKDSGKGSNTTIIPKNTLAMGILHVDEVRESKNTSGKYLQATVTITSGQYKARRIPFNRFPVLTDTKNSEKWREMGLVDLTRIMESGGFFDPADAASYSKLESAFAKTAETQDHQHAIAAIGLAIDGAVVGIRTGIDKSDDGDNEYTSVAEWLTPNPDSHGFRNWKKLHETPAQETPAAGDAPPAAKAESGAASWLGN